MIWDALHIGKAIYTACSTVPGVSLRVYPLRIPQEVDLTTSPAVSYYITAVTPEDTKDSRSLVDTVAFQVSIFASTYTTVTSVASGIRDALDGLTGETSTVSIDYMRFEGWVDDYEDDTKLFSKHMEFSCRVKNTASTNTNDMGSIVVATPVPVTGDYQWVEPIPAGYLIESIIFEESTGNTGQISAGTTTGANDVFIGEGINGGALKVVNVDKIFSLTDPTDIFFNHVSDGDDWNGMSIMAYVMLRKIN